MSLVVGGMPLLGPYIHNVGAFVKRFDMRTEIWLSFGFLSCRVSGPKLGGLGPWPH